MKKIKKVLITTVPFGEVDRVPLDMLESHKIKYLINPLNKKLTEDEIEYILGKLGIIIFFIKFMVRPFLKKILYLRN